VQKFFNFHGIGRDNGFKPSYCWVAGWNLTPGPAGLLIRYNAWSIKVNTLLEKEQRKGRNKKAENNKKENIAH
jgi:hypothetical protein